MQSIGIYEKRSVGLYQTIGFLGSGGSAEVHLARHRGTRQLVAIKFLHAFVTSQKAQKSFAREARMLGRLRHPGIIRVRDAGFYKTQPYFVMDYAAQGSLRKRYP